MSHPVRGHILIVEDDPVASATLASYLTKEGYPVSFAPDGATMRAIFAKGDVDIILLDINLPDDDGFFLLREIRLKSDVGVIMVTANGDEIDRIVALELGADDYIVKPFNMRELFARTKNLMRRTRAIRQFRSDRTELRFSGWLLDTARRTLSAPDGRDVRLTQYEFDLLVVLARSAGRVFSRDTLIEQIGSRDRASNDRTINVLIGRIRQKIEENPSDPRIVITVQGVGYMLSP